MGKADMLEEQNEVLRNRLKRQKLELANSKKETARTRRMVEAYELIMKLHGLQSVFGNQVEF